MTVRGILTAASAAAQRWLVEAGLPLERFVRIVGKADMELLDTKEPEAPRNRRISILLMRETPQNDGG